MKLAVGPQPPNTTLKSLGELEPEHILLPLLLLLLLLQQLVYIYTYTYTYTTVHYYKLGFSPL